MDNIRKKINNLIDNIEEDINIVDNNTNYNNNYNNNNSNNNNKELHIIKFILIENILKVKTISQLGLIKRLFYRIQRINSKRNNIYSKINNYRKFFNIDN